VLSNLFTPSSLIIGSSIGGTVGFDATNNTKIARTDFENIFTKTNRFTGPVTITTTGSVSILDFPTNSTVPAAPPPGTIRTFSYDDNGFVQLENITDLGIRKRLNRDITWVLRNVEGAPITKGQAVYIFSGPEIVLM